MAETLLAILLVTKSASRGETLVYRWPEFPTPSPRLCRPRPDLSLALSHLDNPWRASHPPEDLELAEILPPHDYGRDPSYMWRRTVKAPRNRSQSMGPSGNRNISGRGSPARNGLYKFEAFKVENHDLPEDYEDVLGYCAPDLTKFLGSSEAMWHSKFELVIDDLVFVGHPVCADADGAWRFKPEKIKPGSRTREDSAAGKSPAHGGEDWGSESTESQYFDSKSTLQSFHVVLVLDLPDPSSSASGNLSKYFNILYEQIAFPLTAVLYQEQVLSHFVEKECDTLLALQDSCAAKGLPYTRFASQALEVSSIAVAMKTIFEAIKSSDLAHVTINYLPLQLQLPPHLDSLLHSDDDQRTDFMDPSDEDSNLVWGQSMSLGWKLPAMAPWKALLLLDNDSEVDPYTALRGPQTNADDRKLAEGIIRFLETASVTLSLAELASILDWNLESQVYPIVRWLVLHRRAKIVDTVHAGLKTVFALPPKFDEPLSVLSSKFKEAFPQSSIPHLPKLLALISTSVSKKSDKHFFASVVKAKDSISMYHEVVLWMLKRNMLITLHLRVRIIVTQDLKSRVKHERELNMAQKSILGPTSKIQKKPGPNELDVEKTSISAAVSMKIPSFSFSPRVGNTLPPRFSSTESDKSQISELNFFASEQQPPPPPIQPVIPKLSSETSNSEADEDDSGWDTTEDHQWPSVITEPGKATPMERRWLSAMSDGVDPVVAKRFEQINQYFDGKRSDDEILYRAGITKKQLREVLHHYEEYLETFLHPS